MSRRGGMGFGLVLGMVLGAGAAWVFLGLRGHGRPDGGQARFEGQDLVPEGRVDDAVLLERVRTRVERYCSHPRNIMITVKDGMVTLGGPILARDVDPLLRSVQAIRGVRGVTNCLEVYRGLNGMPVLQD